MAERILLRNAIEAWLLCRKYCNQILSGNPSFQMKKMFVSTLHNVAELFLKQIMLDKNMHAIRDLHNILRGVWNVGKVKDYLDAADLNQYFYDHREDIRTIEFTPMKDSLLGILDVSMVDEGVDFAKWCADLKSGLRILNDARNDQMHFFIDADAFLPWEDFCALCDVMVKMDELARHLWWAPFFSEAPPDQRFYFWDDIGADSLNLKSVSATGGSYHNLIVKSEINKKIAQALKSRNYTDGVSYTLYESVESLRIEFEEFVLRFELMEKPFNFKFISHEGHIDHGTEYDEEGIPTHMIEDLTYYTFEFDESLIT